MAKRFGRASAVLATGIAVLSAIASGADTAGRPTAEANDQDEGWSVYGGDAGGTRFVELSQMTRDNVSELEPAWTHRTGELGQKFARADKLSFETTPIFVGNTLYLTTPTNIVIALEPGTGREKWRFDPRISRTTRYSEATSRGVSSWIDSRAPANSPCSHRLFFGTLDARLIAIDGASGQPCTQFAGSGAVDLARDVRLRNRGDYLVTSPPAIYRDVVIVGSAIGDNRAAELELGIVRAFDARTGALRWTWNPIPESDVEARSRGWDPASARLTGAANAWSMLSVDAGRGLVFIPTGSASPDFFGGTRVGDNSYANSLVALRADTGHLAWHRQLVHHDVWDYDLAAQPMLIDIEREGKSIAAVVQATKTGMLFVFDRETGEPVFEIIERPTPTSDVPGEATSPTQPFTTTPPLVSHAAVTPQDAWGLTLYDRGKCRSLIERYRSEGLYTPPSERGSIVSPSFIGGVNWGSLAFDSERQLVLAAVNHLPAVVTLVPRARWQPEADAETWPDSEFAAQDGTPFGMRRELLLSPWGLPCTAPPWGTLAAVDLRRNKIRWQVMLGSTADKSPRFLPSPTLGMPNMGGPMATAGGLVFIGAATDNYLRAFDIDTGRELWKGRLPAGGQATPMSYMSGGTQYVVIAAGGHGGLDTTRGDYLVAFALPREKRKSQGKSQ
jgi:quinoprotein glucose dehydrogenase